MQSCGWHCAASAFLNLCVPVSLLEEYIEKLHAAGLDNQIEMVREAIANLK